MAQSAAAGSIVAGFRIRSVIGESQMAVVYLADEVDTGGKVALKLLSPSLAKDERFRRRFVRESQLAASLDHPNVVATLGSGEDGGVLYLAMRYIDGSDLHEILRREAPLDPGRAVELVSQAAAALDAAHAAGLVHRDVKPGNILVARDGEIEHAYVCDFGLARHVSSVSSLTIERGFLGTIDYVAPEQIEGQEIGPRADVYSLGCVLFECLSGAKPFDRESELATVYAHLNERPPGISELRPELPHELDAVFSTALAKLPEERYASCGELAAATRAALRGEVVPHRKHRRQLVGLTVLGIVAAGAAVVGTILATNTVSPSPAGPPKITQSAIDGLRLGRAAPFYEHTLGGYRQFTLSRPFSSRPLFPALSFEQPAVGVYFPTHSRNAFVLTTWNPAFHTAAGIGPCSSLAQMHKVYGRRAVPTYSGSSPNGKQHGSWQLGRNLLFMTQDHKTISSVVLFTGPTNARASSQTPGTHQGWANYIGAVETACK